MYNLKERQRRLAGIDKDRYIIRLEQANQHLTSEKNYLETVVNYAQKKEHDQELTNKRNNDAAMWEKRYRDELKKKRNAQKNTLNWKTKCKDLREEMKALKEQTKTEMQAFKETTEAEYREKLEEANKKARDARVDASLLKLKLKQLTPLCQDCNRAAKPGSAYCNNHTWERKQ